MSSLQDQLLKAGLVSKDKATKTKSAQRKQAKIKRKHKIDTVDENKAAATKLLQEQAEKARRLNQQKNALAEEKAIIAQIKQLVEVNQQATGKPAVSFNFSDHGAIKKIEVSNSVHKYLTSGTLAIARQGENYTIVPKAVAEKIQQRSDEFIVLLNQQGDETDQDDPYADYQIPDDLMW